MMAPSIITYKAQQIRQLKRKYLQPRPRDFHKGQAGHVLIIGGDAGFSGAPRLSAMAALRVGAGLVSIATHIENAPMMNAACPEIICFGVRTTKELPPLIAKADVIIVGPGLGQSDWAKMLWLCAMEQSVPLVIDADALNLLAQHPRVVENAILTPHPKEAARLLHRDTNIVQQDRVQAIFAIKQQYGGVCVLKGAGSLILGQDDLPVRCEHGNPGMASAGMGDILSGVIGGLLAQKIPTSDATILAVFLHAMAGDLAARQGERGLIATDLLPYLRQLVNL